jgi:serine incorporator 1/3
LVQENEQKPSNEPTESRKVTGVVTNQEDYGTHNDEESPPETAESMDRSSCPPVTWKLNLVLAVISCFYAMALTGWGSIESGGTPANPDVGNISMWMIIASQWVVLVLYLWTLIAPRLFPDRDFS